MEAVITETVHMETEKLNWFDRQAMNFEESRFGAMAVMIGFQTCWGSIAAGLAYGNETIYNLAICGIASMLNNTILIAQGPAKWCVGIFLSATVVNAAIILIEVIGG